jgi:hypothetical protein
MEPVVQTSRLRLAISSVQTFIQRCLMNLEGEVQPSALDAEQWQWMKHYRVWEVNRKIFLFPENWLEPEFRDDKTELFEELEGTLLQGDITNDLAEDAFFKYLQGLEEIARLEIVSMECEEKTGFTHRTRFMSLAGRKTRRTSISTGASPTSCGHPGRPSRFRSTATTSSQRCGAAASTSSG